MSLIDNYNKSLTDLFDHCDIDKEYQEGLKLYPVVDLTKFYWKSYLNYQCIWDSDKRPNITGKHIIYAETEKAFSSHRIGCRYIFNLAKTDHEDAFIYKGSIYTLILKEDRNKTISIVVLSNDKEITEKDDFDIIEEANEISEYERLKKKFEVKA